MKKKIANRFFTYVSALAILIAAIVLICNIIVENSTQDLHFADINKVPRRSVALLLGTNKYTLLGSENEYYTRRIDAVAELYKAGKIDSVLISGDNSSKEYNEPEMMLADLEAVGIPKSRCLLDYGGRRTLDSVVRAKDVFGKNNYIIVSQEFHNRRALYIALHNDIDAVAYDAIYPIYKKSIKVKVREMFARVKVVADIILGVKPHFTT